VLEAGTVALLREVGLGARMDREGHPHDGSAIAWEGRPRFFIDTQKFTGKRARPRSPRISTRRATLRAERSSTKPTRSSCTRSRRGDRT
jgi:hypothetical protein